MEPGHFLRPVSGLASGDRLPDRLRWWRWSVLGWWLWRSTSRALAVGFGLIIGGALGNNLVDRLVYGKVADFFHFYGFGYDWYVFNIADLAITLGAMAILYDVLKPQPRRIRATRFEMRLLTTILALSLARRRAQRLRFAAPRRPA